MKKKIEELAEKHLSSIWWHGKTSFQRHEILETYLAAFKEAQKWTLVRDGLPSKNENIIAKYIIVSMDPYNDVFHQTWGRAHIDWRGEWWVEDRHLGDPDYIHEIISWKYLEYE